ncbi:hypothetical protein ACBP46_02940 [Paenalcaligenes hominis]|uniref:hypothetical protein n=1 Tax=Paenalcaligenes hominis TaxID=643674 RepID=UPI0035253F55
MNTFNQILRSLLFFVLTLVGMLMAVVFMISTAIAIAILYIVAKISGRPFAIKSYWDQRRRNRVRPHFTRSSSADPASTKRNTQNVTDIEMREIP